MRNELRRCTTPAEFSQARYNELIWFAMQYSEMKQSKPEAAAMIEQAALLADSEIAPYILRNVTQGVPFHALMVPCGRRQFYEKRRRFFVELDKLKW